MNTTEVRSEVWRPQHHFTSHRNWINDPNGLVWFEGEYHLFFQYNPHGSQWGHMSWGHAVSTNLIDWTELPVAIPEDERAMAFSGSVVVDTHNTSGLGRPGEPVLVACYTACLQPPAQRQVQDLAFSTDRGRTWQRHAGNPVLDIGLKDFRDPKVFWHAPSAQWVMVVVLPDEREARFYGSPNLLQWNELSRFRAPMAGQGIWECPDLIELPVVGGGTVWMLKVDAFGGHPSGETGARLFFGHFDGRRFTAEASEDGGQWADHGSDFYAALSWSQLPAEPWQGQAVWLAWMSCHRYAPHVPTEGWRGAMTLPRQLKARRREGRWELIQQVVPQAQALRGHPQDMAARTLNAEQPTLVLWTDERAGRGGQVGSGLELSGAIRRIEAGTTGVAVRLVATTAAGIDTRDPRAHVIEVGYDAARGALYIDRSRSGRIPQDDPRYAARRWAPCRAPSAVHPLDIALWWDESSVEVLADGGAVALTEQAYPSGTHRRAEIAMLTTDLAGSLVKSSVELGSWAAWSLRAARFD